MKKTIKIMIISACLASGFFSLSRGLSATQGNPLYVGHEAVAQFDQIPDWARIAASAKKVMFMHASVGMYIENWGLNCLQGTWYESACNSYPDYKYDRRNWDWPKWDSPVDTQGKFAQFTAMVAAEHNNYDIMGMKLCYTDWWELDWTDYRDMMLQLEADYPGTTFIWATMPIATTAGWDPTGDWCQTVENFNTNVRALAQTNNRILYDIADIEAHDANGNRCHEGCETMCDEHGGPGHPNLDGSITLAKGFWVLMAKIAGWNPTCDLPGDLDCDCDVDMADIMLVANCWNSSVGDDDYDPAYDLDGDGDIDIVDIMLVAVHWGDSC